MKTPPIRRNSISSYGDRLAKRFNENREDIIPGFQAMAGFSVLFSLYNNPSDIKNGGMAGILTAIAAMIFLDTISNQNLKSGLYGLVNTLTDLNLNSKKQKGRAVENSIPTTAPRPQ